MLRELAEDVFEGDGVKAEVLAAGADGLRNVLRLGRRHHEDDVVGRLFERFQQRVEGGIGDLVRFVEDIDLVTVAGRAIAGGVAQLANLVDAAVGGGVDFDHIDGVSLRGFRCRIRRCRRAPASAARACRFRRAAVERHGQDAGDGGLADAAMAAENVAVRDAFLRKRVEQRAGDVVLPGDVREALGAIFAGENEVGHSGNEP